MMEKLCASSSLTIQNSCSSKNKKSDVKKEILTPETLEESLQNWKLPPFSSSDVYKRSCLFKSCHIKTVEAEIPLSEGYATIPLLSDDLRKTCPKQFSLLHVGIIQVGLKPEKIGSNASATICVRDKSCRKFDNSLFGLVESSFSDGPIYFSYFPSRKPRYISLSVDLSNTLCIEVESEGCSSLMYRMHYRALRRQGDERTRRSGRFCADEGRATTLFLTNVAAESNIGVTTKSKKVFWGQVAVPERWAEWRETAEEHVLRVDVPSRLRKEEVRVEVEEGRILHVSGERCMTIQPVENNNGTVMMMLTNVGPEIKFRSRYKLPENTKPELVKAAMENGVVTVMVAKKEVGKKAEVKVVDIVG